MFEFSLSSVRFAKWVLSTYLFFLIVGLGYLEFHFLPAILSSGVCFYFLWLLFMIGMSNLPSSVMESMISKVGFEFDLYFLSNFMKRVIYSLWFLQLCWVDGGHFVAAVVFFWWCYWFLMVDGRNYTVLYLIDWLLKHLFLIPFSASITAFYFSF